jgi:hypothetical protein
MTSLFYSAALDCSGAVLVLAAAGETVRWKAPRICLPAPMMSAGMLNGLEWKQDAWIGIKHDAAAHFEMTRKSKNSILTFGLSGPSGEGLYVTNSKESGAAPELVLALGLESGGVR